MRGVADVYPLTPAQLGILFDSLRDPDPELYFEQVRCDLVGSVDVDVVRRAWADTIAAHPALRTIWVWDGLDEPVQVVRERVEVPWTVLDWRDRDDRRAALDTLARDDRRRGFDLSKPPVLRLTVVRVEDDRIHLIWSFHHIMLDGWSAARVLDEVRQRCAGRAVAPGRPFRDHVAWIASRDGDEAAAHWRELLHGFDEPNRVALGHRHGDTRVRRASGYAEIDEATTRRIVGVARAHRVTTNTLAQAAWATVLSCYSGDADVVFGVTDSGRSADLDGVEDMVGMFLATLPMRLRLEPDRSIGDWWREILEQQLELTRFQHSSLAEISRASDVPAGVALFETALAFENYPRHGSDDLPIAIEHHEVFEQTRFPLTLMIGPGPRLGVLALVDESRFDRDDATTLVERFLDVLTQMVDDPDRPLRTLSILTAAERRRILVEWNQTDAPLPDTTVHVEIERRAAEHPGAVALVDGDRTWTFEELVEAAASLARRIDDGGSLRGRTVGVVLPRSIEAVAAMLAAMRCGAAYVPLEPDTPAERLHALVDEARLALAITTADHAPIVAGRGIRWVDIESGGAARVDPVAPPVDVSPDENMFVVFTSGSTGRPKGVPGTHRAVLNRLAWQFENHPFDPDETACHKTTLGFVDHVAELWGPLVAGRSVVIVPDAIVRDIEAFVGVLADHAVRRIVVVPSLLEVILDSVPDLGARLPTLTLWNVSGERLSRALADRFRAAMPHARLLNVYGMSEVMADATCFEGEWSGSVETLPIGRPIRNQRVYVLDQLGRPAPVGVPGQIWVSGAGVASGYWQRDDLSAERFLPNPHGDGLHDRRYATGDVGRWTSDGDLEYLGRVDRQVKVRGIRVELGDVEASIRRLEGVRDVLVVDRSAADEPTRLVAYVVAGPDVDLSDARRRLAAAVPQHLVPAALHRIDAIPLLASGKPDRNALPGDEPATTPLDVGELDDELRTMLAIWRDVIPLSEVRPDDDFFEIGGHSIAAMRLMSRVKREHGVDLPLAVLYERTTPLGLLDLVHAERSRSSPAPSRHLVPITSGVDDRHRIYCVHGAGGNVLNLRDLARELAPEWGVTGIQASGVDGVTPPHPTIDAMCEAYIAEVLADGAPGPLFIAGFSGGGIVAYEIAVRLARRGEEVGAVVLLDTFHPSVRGRRRTIGEHLGALVRQGSAYLRERHRVRRQRQLYERADDLVREETQEGDAVPHELRDAHLVSNLRSILDDYEPPHHDGAVWLFAASDVLDVFRHAGPDRGWSRCAPNLVVERVAGDHHDFVLDPNARGLAAALRARLDAALRAGAAEEQR